MGIKGHIGDDMEVGAVTSLTILVSAWPPAPAFQVGSSFSLTTDQMERIGVVAVIVLAIGILYARRKRHR
jgi:hypothetical protein